VHAVTVHSDAPLFRSEQRTHDGETDTTYGVRVQGAACLMEMHRPDSEEAAAARYALGSGRYGLTFLGEDRAGDWYELRMTYYTQLHMWDYTPFLQPGGDRPQNPKGLLLDRKQLTFCYSCHVTTLRLEADGTPTAASHLNIGCERCHGSGRRHIEATTALLAGDHGPGRRHIEATTALLAGDHGPGRRHIESSTTLQAGSRATQLKMEDLKAASRDRNMAVCNACHSAPSDIPKRPEQAVILARFAGTALQQSRCYLRSGTLSCLTCHNSHSLASAPSGGYEAACLGCHSSRKSLAVSVRSNRSVPEPEAAQVTLCKINPRTGCIGCHMPVQTTRSFARIGFHNHWIKVYANVKRVGQTE
jgi:hypothetical protein